MPLPWGAAPNYQQPDFPRPKIDESMDRAITLRQLRDLREFVKRLCKVSLLQYPDDDYHRSKGIANEPILWMNINQHDIAREVIKKLIPQHPSCSWVEFVSPSGHPQCRRYFVSHSWSESFRDFMAAIEHHAFAHGVGLDDAYWTCIYAIDQWSIDLGQTLENSPFYSALLGAESTLLMLDRNFDAFSRVWIIYEMHQTLERDQLVEVGTPLGLMGTPLVSSGPFVVAMKGLKSSEATSSEPADRRSIFNKIAGHSEKHGLKLEQSKWVLDTDFGEPGAYERELVVNYEKRFTSLDEEVRRRTSSEECSLPAARTPKNTRRRADLDWCRGITLAQLRAFTQNVKAACSSQEWKEERATAPLAGQRLAWHQVTWVHTLEYFVKPMTAGETRNGRQSSYIELEVDVPQQPVYFVGLRWGLPVQDTMAAIEWVAEARQLRDTTTFWIDQLAMSHGTHNDEVSDPRDSSMFNAIRECNGVIMVLDDTFNCLKKTWGTYAFYVAMELAKSVDIACPSGAMATTRPFAEGCWECGNFSPRLAEQLMEIQIEKTGASVESDKRRILGLVAGVDDIDQPPPVHERYVSFNKHLHRSVVGPYLRDLARKGDIHATASILHELPNLNLGSERLKGVFGETPLHVAASSGHAHTVALLLNNMASVNVQDFDGETPLHHAVLAAKPQMVKKLLELDADAELESYYSENSLDVAKQRVAAFLGDDLSDRCQKVCDALESCLDMPFMDRSVASLVSEASQPSLPVTRRSWSKLSKREEKAVQTDNQNESQRTRLYRTIAICTLIMFVARRLLKGRPRITLKNIL